MPPIRLSPASYPPPVVPGDRVGVAALSGPLDPLRLERGLEGLRSLGFVPVVASNLSRTHQLFAGSDDERLAGFHQLLRDDSLGAVFFARGGHGLLRLLPRIDWDLLGARPRAFVGYSDLTPLLNLIPQRFGWVAFHGPMAAVDIADGLEQDEVESLLGALGGHPVSPLPVGEILRGGVAAGPLRGGCLSLLTATLGTPFATSLEGSLAFWEDVGEPAYRLDRMLTHLGRSGSLTGASGMVVGEIALTDEDKEVVSRGLEALREACLAVRGPVAWGLPAGHRRPNFTLPLGAWAELDGERGELRLAAASSLTTP